MGPNAKAFGYMGDVFGSGVRTFGYGGGRTAAG